MPRIGRRGRFLAAVLVGWLAIGVAAMAAGRADTARTNLPSTTFAGFTITTHGNGDLYHISLLINTGVIVGAQFDLLGTNPGNVNIQVGTGSVVICTAGSPVIGTPSYTTYTCLGLDLSPLQIRSVTINT